VICWQADAVPHLNRQLQQKMTGSAFMVFSENLRVKISCRRIILRLAGKLEGFSNSLDALLNNSSGQKQETQKHLADLRDDLVWPGIQHHGIQTPARRCTGKRSGGVSQFSQRRGSEHRRG
jgi:hypothetical protein